MRAGFVLALFILLYTAEKAVVGFQSLTGPGVSARFGQIVFQLLALLQLTLALFFGLLFVAGRISQEKDRATLILLLMSDMKDRELVGGKLSSGIVSVAVMLVATLPVMFILQMLGGITTAQILWTAAISAMAAFASASWGAFVAFWRDKTFQTLAIGLLGMVAFLAVIEIAVAAVGATNPVGMVLGSFDPYRSLMEVICPLAFQTDLGPVSVSAWPGVLAMAFLAAAFQTSAVLGLRKWNPVRSVYQFAQKAKQDQTEEAAAERDTSRDVWNVPIIWREIRTRAYGRRVIFIKAVYMVMALAGYAFIAISPADPEPMLGGLLTAPGFVFVALALVTFVLVNAQAVTSLTSERDGRTLELLLVTEITSREFVLGKIGGVLYNTKELIIAPLIALVLIALQGQMSAENLIFAGLGFLSLVAFAAVVGFHSAMSHANSRNAIAASLGTVFFLFVGIFIFILLLVEARSSFALQFQSFLVFIVAGSILLGASLTYQNPSAALWLASAILPFLTFYSIASYMLGRPGESTLAVVAAYLFATIAMLIPALSEFTLTVAKSVERRR
ncbi:ABC-2 family transporter protein [Stratiformator vulcanicus]|uniref:ABC-2 family transporter protein n=2 Tax=Stratiformator vulcanicus TaxID=2527980 RepID=A0A517R6Z3_9PLAN|nr:ABC-2 family transporter protein [Stratiformator vulcanicus]